MRAEALEVVMRRFLSRKIHQLHSVMWFLGGFGVASGTVIGIIAIALAICIDAGISIILSKEEATPGSVDGSVWWSR